MKECYFNANIIRARIGEMPFYLQGTTYGCHRDEKPEIKQTKGFKRYTCQVV